MSDADWDAPCMHHVTYLANFGSLIKIAAKSASFFFSCTDNFIDIRSHGQVSP